MIPILPFLNDPKYLDPSYKTDLDLCDCFGRKKLRLITEEIRYIRFGSKLYRQIVGIPMDTNCAPLVADLFLFCYERDFMLSLSEDKQSGVIEAFNSTSRYLDDLLNIDNNFFDSMVNRIYPSETSVK